jgi:hypothetical protein
MRVKPARAFCPSRCTPRSSPRMRPQHASLLLHRRFTMMPPSSNGDRAAGTTRRRKSRARSRGRGHEYMIGTPAAYSDTTAEELFQRPRGSSRCARVDWLRPSRRGCCYPWSLWHGRRSWPRRSPPPDTCHEPLLRGPAGCSAPTLSSLYPVSAPSPHSSS